jgi:16S rRNA (guanine966-N2)-methyltransferase
MAALGGSLEGATVLDLFAGSGALGLEALSRGASKVVFVERARNAQRILRTNVELLGAGEYCRVVGGDAMAYAKRLGPGAFDLALADPPYDLGFARQLAELFAEKGFARELWVEHRSSEDMPAVPGMSQRRYGDTTLTTLKRDE